MWPLKKLVFMSSSARSPKRVQSYEILWRLEVSLHWF